MLKLKSMFIPLFAIVFILMLIAFSATYTVRFTEIGVKTTFGSANESSIVNEPGLHFKAPYPFQSVTKYDKRIRLVQTRSETVQTADDFQIIVESYLFYRVSDPLKFFRSFSNAVIVQKSTTPRLRTMSCVTCSAVLWVRRASTAWRTCSQASRAHR